MGILNYVPTFKVVEPNRLTAPNTGQVLSQFLADDTDTNLFTTKNEIDFIENGLILGLNSDLTIGAFVEGTHTQPFLHFTEELVTFLSGNNKFAVEPDSAGEYYPRGLALYVGDTFTTDNYALDSTGAEGASLADTTAAIVDGKITVLASDTDLTETAVFAVEASTLPTGEDAVRVTYLGL